MEEAKLPLCANCEPKEPMTRGEKIMQIAAISIIVIMILNEVFFGWSPF